MKVLFISSGSAGQAGEVVKNEGESLKVAGINIDYFLIKPGFLGHPMSIRRLRILFKSGKYDLADAHYSLSGFIAGVAGCKPLVVSLMGSDIYTSGFSRVVISLFPVINGLKLLSRPGK